MEEVKINPEKHFIGKPCVKCGSEARYISDGRCVPCGKLRAKKDKIENREKRKQYERELKEERYSKSLDGIFYEGTICSKCNGAVRYASNGTCVSCSTQYKQDIANSLREHEHELTYVGKPCKKCGETERYVSCSKCLNCHNINGGIWRRENKERTKQISKRWYKENTERHRKSMRRWEENNKDKVLAIRHKYRTSKENNGGEFTSDEWNNLRLQYNNRCLFPGCRNTKLEADHIVPVSKKGTSHIWNIQPLCRSHNASKADRIIDYRPIENIPQEYIDFLASLE